jgi:hypothetical protein
MSDQQHPYKALIRELEADLVRLEKAEISRRGRLLIWQRWLERIWPAPQTRQIAELRTRIGESMRALRTAKSDSEPKT